MAIDRLSIITGGFRRSIGNGGLNRRAIITDGYRSTYVTTAEGVRFRLVVSSESQYGIVVVECED